LLQRFLVNGQIDQECRQPTIHRGVGGADFTDLGRPVHHSIVVVTIHLLGDLEAEIGVWMTCCCLLVCMLIKSD